MLPRWKRVLRPVAIGILLVFTWVAIEPWNFAQAAQGLPTSRLSSRQPSATSPKTPPTAAEAFEESLRAIKGEVRAAMEGDEYQKRLEAQIDALRQGVEEGARQLELTRQAADRLALALEEGRAQEEALKAFRAQERRLHKVTRDLNMRVSGIEGLLKGMPFPAELDRRRKEDQETWLARTKDLTARLSTIAKRGETQRTFDQKEYGAFVHGTMEVEQALRQLRASLEALAQEATPERRRAQLLSQVMAKRQGLLAADRQIRQEFAQTEAHLNKAGLPPEILDRHAQAVQDYEENFQKLREFLNSIDQLHQEYLTATQQGDQTAAASKEGDLESKLTELNQFLQQNVKEPPHTPLDPKKLPHRTPQVTPRKPRLKKDDFSELRQPIRLAFHGDPSTLLLAQAPSDLPTPEDLAETIEVQFTPEIQALATQLENNPVQIYNFVRNNVDFVPTFGSIQGAQMCLLTKQCNDMDTASLLIALLRTSGIPARYVIGTIEVPIDQVMNWVGGFTDARAALNFIASGGTPVTGLISGGQLVAARLEHAWVEAFVDYIPSRGAIHKQGDTWIPLDASFKQYDETTGVDISATLSAVGFDATTLIDEASASATKDEVNLSATLVNTTLIENRINNLRVNLLNHFQQNSPNATINDILGIRTIHQQSLSILSATLPFRVVSAQAPIPSVPSSLQHKLVISVAPSGFSFDPLFSFNSPLASIGSKQLTISYFPATQEDEDTAGAFGGILKTPAYLLRLKAFLKLEGDIKSAGGPITLGEPQELQIRFDGPFGASDAVQHDITAGGYYAIALDLGAVVPALLKERQDKLTGVITKGQATKDESLGQILHTLGLSYFVQTQTFVNTSGRALGVVNLKLGSEGLVGTSVPVQTLFGIPAKVSFTGLFIDVKRNINAPIAKDRDQETAKSFMINTGIFSSGLEHGIFEEVMQTDGVSAIKLLRSANDSAVPIHFISKDNVDTILPQLNLPSRDIRAFQDGVNAGKIIYTPQQPLTVHGFTGIGYLILDPETGAGGYIISGALGSLNGGSALLDDLFEALGPLLDFIKDAAILITGLFT